MRLADDPVAACVGPSSGPAGDPCTSCCTTSRSTSWAATAYLMSDQSCISQSAQGAARPTPLFQRRAHLTSTPSPSLARLQTPSSAAHLSRPTLQTLFPSTSSHHAHSSSVAALTKLDSRLASLQAKLDASLVDARADERTDDETVSLKMRRDLVDAAGTRWRESVTRLEGLGQMVEREAGGEQDRCVPGSARMASAEGLCSLSSVLNLQIFTCRYGAKGRRVPSDLYLGTLLTRLIPFTVRAGPAVGFNLELRGQPVVVHQTCSDGRTSAPDLAWRSARYTARRAGPGDVLAEVRLILLCPGS